MNVNSTNSTNSTRCTDHSQATGYPPASMRRLDDRGGFIQIQAGFIQAVYIEVCFLSHAGWGGKGYSFLIYRAYTQSAKI